MQSASTGTIHPDPADALPAAFRIEGHLAVRAILRELAERHVLVTLYVAERLEDFAVSRVVHLADDEVEFDLSGQERFAAALAQAHRVVGVAFPGKVKTQFLLDRFAVADEGDGPVLRARLPALLHRIQRREAFRVALAESEDAWCVCRVPPDGEVRYRVTDLSVGGASILLPPGVPAPEPGTIWAHCRIETADGRVLPCDLSVRHVDRQHCANGSHQVGVAFHAMPHEVMRQVQVYVIEVEKRLGRRR
ncbi:MAG: flagellar brake protein [Burkholderiales bacterium]|nr:flagellar brake protein [Burkholderiales bacterium]